MTPEFQPTLLGTEIVFEHDDSKGMITDETPCDVYIESPLVTGWTSKAVFFSLIED